MSVGSVGTTVISAVAMIIFSRALGPTQFGIFSVLFSLLLILSKIGDFGVNTAVQRYIAKVPDQLGEIKRYVGSGTYLKLLITLTVAVVGITSSPWITLHILNLSSDSIVLVRLVFFLTGGVVFYEYVNSVLQGVQAFNLSIISNTIQSLTKLLLALFVLISNSISLLPIIILYLLAPVLGGLIGFLKLPFTLFAPNSDQKSLAQILAVSKWTGISILAAVIADNLDILIVQNQLTSYDTGLYSAAVRIASIASLVAWSLGTVLNVRVARYSNPSHLRKYLRKATILAVGSFVGILGLMLFSKPALLYTVGVDFLPATTPLNLLFISTALLTATAPFVALFYLFDRPQYFAISGILTTVFLLGFDLVLIPTLGLAGAGVARIVARLAALIFTLFYAYRSYQEKYGQA